VFVGSAPLSLSLFIWCERGVGEAGVPGMAAAKAGGGGAGPENGRERVYDEDSGITWVDFTDIINKASAGARELRRRAAARGDARASRRSSRQCRRSRARACGRRTRGRQGARVRECLRARAPRRRAACATPYPRAVPRPAELDKGQMLHADSFNLGDSMSALEMMDPKMDAGVINEKNASVIPVGACPSTSRRPRARASAGPVPRRSDDCRAPRCVSQTSALIAGWWTWTRMCRRRS